MSCGVELKMEAFGNKMVIKTATKEGVWLLRRVYLKIKGEILMDAWVQSVGNEEKCCLGR